MTIDSQKHSNEPSANQQRRQANILLIRLQWLFILLLIVALAWLYVSQQRFHNQINERLQSNEQVVTRLNERDDRLFATNQQALPESNTMTSSQAQNQLDLLRLQLQATDQLLTNNQNQAALGLLRGLQWQLSQPTNEIAPALTIIIKQSLADDIKRLQAQSTQSSAWQLQNLAIQNIQEFLYSRERRQATDKGANRSSAKVSSSNALTHRQLMIHDVIMTLNLAMQASNMHEKDQLIGYLTQARQQLKTLSTHNASTQKNNINSDDVLSNASSINRSETMSAPTSIVDAIALLDKLIANAPNPTSLATTQVLMQPKA